MWCVVSGKSHMFFHFKSSLGSAFCINFVFFNFILHSFHRAKLSNIILTARAFLPSPQRKGGASFYCAKQVFIL